MKSEAERRFEMFCQSTKDDIWMNDGGRAVAQKMFRALFDPLPPEPEPAKSLGQVLVEAVPNRGPWSVLPPSSRAMYEREAEAVRVAVESRRPKPTVDEVADALDSASRASTLSSRSDLFRNLARVIFPLFGCEP